MLFRSAAAGIRGGAGNAAQVMAQVEVPASKKNAGSDRVYQNRVAAFMRNSMDVASQIELESQRRTVRSTGTNLIDRQAK